MKYKIHITNLDLEIELVPIDEPQPDPDPDPEPDTTPLPSLINVGPGQQFSEIHELDPNLIPNSAIIKVHYRPEPYRSKLALIKPGIVLEGVLGPNGEFPIISGHDALTHEKCPLGLNIQGVSVVCVSKLKVTDVVDIKNLEIRDAWEENLFTNSAGEKLNYGGGAGLIRATSGNVFVENCRLVNGIHGIFAKCTEGHIITATLVDCEIVGCGNQSGSTDEATYTECGHTKYIRCKIHKNRHASTQPIHSRDANLLVEDSYIEGGLLSILSNSCDSGSPLMATGSIVGGILEIRNSILNNSSASEMIGMRTDWAWTETKHTLKIINSTFIKKGSGWKTFWCICRHSSHKVEVQDSTFISLAQTPTGSPVGTYFSIGNGETFTFSGQNKMIAQSPINGVYGIWQNTPTSANFLPANWTDTFIIEGNLSYNDAASIVNSIIPAN